jgi:glutamine amidotransferase-like uncharacterized protein
MIAPSTIRQVYIYSGHSIKTESGKILKGPYSTSFEKDLNLFTEIGRKRSWSITVILGEELKSLLEPMPDKQTLLVIPAGPSTVLEEVFSKTDFDCIKQSVQNGLFLYTTCGSSYAAAKTLSWGTKLDSKANSFGIFDGSCKGPLFPNPAQPFGEDFECQSLRICYAGKTVNLFSGGGGSFFYDKEDSTKTLAEYDIEDLTRAGKDPSWISAVVLSEIGKGRAIFSMVHPATGSSEARLLKDQCPKRTDNWEAIAYDLSPQSMRYDFVDYLISKLEN